MKPKRGGPRRHRRVGRTLDKSRRHSQWVTEVRAAALSRVAHGVNEAREAFDALDAEQKWRLVEEIVTTRTRELLCAYPDAVDVMAGHRRKRGRLATAPDPCVKFLVKKKWSRRKRGPSQRKIPQELLTYGWARGQRTLYAVPTDVEKTKIRSGVRPHGSRVTVT